MSKKFKFTPETNILDALELDERVSEAFQSLGLKCLECVAAVSEDLRLAALYHEKDLQKIIETLNQIGIRKNESNQK